MSTETVKKTKVPAKPKAAKTPEGETGSAVKATPKAAAKTKVKAAPKTETVDVAASRTPTYVARGAFVGFRGYQILSRVRAGRPAHPPYSCDQSRRLKKVTRRKRRTRNEIALTSMTVPRALRKSESVGLRRPYLTHQRIVITGTAYLMKTKPTRPARPRKGKKIITPKGSRMPSMILK
jgi:hypothetical protein